MEIPTGYAQANLRFTGTGYPTGAEITLGLDVSTYASTPDDAALDVAQSWNTVGLDAMVPASVTLSEVAVKYGPTATGPTGIWTGTITGTRSGEQLQPGTAILVRKITALGGKAGRGRFFHPGAIEEDTTAAGLLTSTPLAAWQSAVSDWLTTLQAADLSPVVLHGAGSPLSTPTPITSFQVDGKVATQRRRLRR